MLLECGAKVYAIDFTGMYGISAMVDKCPPLALKVVIIIRAYDYLLIGLLHKTY